MEALMLLAVFGFELARLTGSKSLAAAAEWIAKEAE
jgi:hypothetical protein